MPGEADTAVNYWAVLIGINFYPQDKCLEGCVRDAESVKQYLEAGPKPVDIVILTATKPSDPRSTRPVEKPDFWPTRKNAVSSLNRILGTAKKGDFVYIHFSGHGTRRDHSGEHPNKKPGNLAFVLFEDNEHGSSYLNGPVLASCLRKMAGKGLIVTLVLDCCYSGSVLRGGDDCSADVRAVKYKPGVDAAFPQELHMDCSDSGNTFRNSEIASDQWLVNPDGYTILSACGPHERAWECKVEGQRRGALTYFLIDALSALRKRDAEVTHQSLYQHLHTRFHVSWPRQTPMRYGNGKRSFFGRLGIASDPSFVSVYRADDDRLCLGAGQAHGVYKGDEYAVYPFHLSEVSAGQIRGTAPAIVRVDTVRCLTSDLVGVKPASAAHIKTGWKAKPITYLSPLKISVRLAASVGSPHQWQEAAKQQCFLNLRPANGDTEPCTFNVTVNDHEEYEIFDGSHEPVVSLPTIPLNTNGAINRVVDILQHLATFKYFEGVENRSPSAFFEGSFSLLPDRATGMSGYFEVGHGDAWGFAVENSSDRPLYIAIFNFTPSWQVVNLVSQAGEGDFMVVPPKEDGNNGRQEIRLRMEVPQSLQSRGKNQCEDIVKVFITSKATSFPSMVLPEISLCADVRGRVRPGLDQLSRFLSELTGRFRGGDDAFHEEWATRNLIVRTTVCIENGQLA
ncbi:hypothetical protein DL767_010131 [Monosporascus sp. MG133]|nr:hypothetical protein DL767_010131 [Monosporascus sp. MG133]